MELYNGAGDALQFLTRSLLLLVSGHYLKDPTHVKLHFTRGQEITLIFEITFTPRLVIFRRVNYSTGSKIYSTGSKNYSTKGS